MDRRHFALSLLGAKALFAAPAISKTERKQWAREHLKGMENALMPSFSPDFKSLDEEGIRADVRQSIRHGFCAMTITPTGTSAEQRARMLQVVRDEARDRILTSVIVGGTADAQIESLANAEKLGCSHALIMFPSGARAETEDEVHAQFRKIIDSTSMAILLYGTDVPALRRFHPSGIPVSVFERLADAPNVVGMKLTQPMPAGVAFELCERLSSKLILGPVNLDLVPVLAKNYKNIQWSGQWIVESVQSPEKPYAVELMDLVSKHRISDAMKVYWQMQPLIQAIYDLQAPLLLKGSHPWAHMKYHQWSTGGNGGLLPLKASDVLPVLDAKGRDLIKATYRKAGITPVDHPEEEFITGKAAYARGVRASQLAYKPLYA